MFNNNVILNKNYFKYTLQFTIYATSQIGGLSAQTNSKKLGPGKLSNGYSRIMLRTAYSLLV